jgi:SPP1 family predicted phage head-tail adaptor
MRTGRLDKQVQIARHVETTDSHGEMISNTSTFATRWASIEPIVGREYMMGIGANSVVTTRIRLRCDAVTVALTPANLIYFGGTTYDIETVINPNMENREIILMCASGVRNNAK